MPEGPFCQIRAQMYVYIWFKNGPEQAILVCIIHTLRLPLIVRAGVFSSGRSSRFGLNLPLLPYFMYAKSKGSGETMFMCWLTWAFAAGCYDNTISTYFSCAGEMIMAARN